MNKERLKTLERSVTILSYILKKHAKQFGDGVIDIKLVQQPRTTLSDLSYLLDINGEITPVNIVCDGLFDVKSTEFFFKMGDNGTTQEYVFSLSDSDLIELFCVSTQEVRLELIKTTIPNKYISVYHQAGHTSQSVETISMVKFDDHYIMSTSDLYTSSELSLISFPRICNCLKLSMLLATMDIKEFFNSGLKETNVRELKIKKTTHLTHLKFVMDNDGIVKEQKYHAYVTSLHAGLIVLSASHGKKQHTVTMSTFGADKGCTIDTEDDNYTITTSYGILPMVKIEHNDKHKLYAFCDSKKHIKLIKI